jgi:hypothetical protein
MGLTLGNPSHDRQTAEENDHSFLFSGSGENPDPFLFEL